MSCLNDNPLRVRAGRGQDARKLLLCALSAILCVLCGVLLTLAQPENKQLTIYGPQVSYSIPVVKHADAEFVDLVGALEPLGTVSTKREGRKLKLSFNNASAEFSPGKTEAKVAGKPMELPEPFHMANDRGLLPLGAVPRVVSLLTGMGADYHAGARR